MYLCTDVSVLLNHVMYSSLYVEDDIINFSKLGVLWLQYFNGETVKKGGYWQVHRVGNLSEDNQKVPRENQVCFQSRFF